MLAPVSGCSGHLKQKIILLHSIQLVELAVLAISSSKWGVKRSVWLARGMANGAHGSHFTLPQYMVSSKQMLNTW